MLFEAQLMVEALRRVVLGAYHYKRYVAAGTDGSGEAAGQVDTVSLASVFGPRLHGEHGAVVGLDHPRGQFAGRENAVRRQRVYQTFEHFHRFHVVGRIKIVDGGGVFRPQVLHLYRVVVPWKPANSKKNYLYVTNTRAEMTCTKSLSRIERRLWFHRSKKLTLLF